MEKVRSNYPLQSAERDTLLCKLKLEDILATLRQEKQQYDKIQIQKINRYKQEIHEKDQLILKLMKELRHSRTSLEETNKVNLNYQNVILQLKRSFFKIFSAASKISDSEAHALQSSKLALSRAKSDLHKRPFKSEAKQSVLASSLKQMRIDINSYFLSLKQLKLTKVEKSSLDSKESKKTQHTDKEMRSSGCQNFKETSCFKDGIGKDIQSRQIKKDINMLQGTQVHSNLKTTWASQYKQKDWKSTQ